MDNHYGEGTSQPWTAIEAEGKLDFPPSPQVLCAPVVLTFPDMMTAKSLGMARASRGDRRPEVVPQPVVIGPRDACAAPFAIVLEVLDRAVLVYAVPALAAL